MGGLEISPGMKDYAIFHGLDPEERAGEVVMTAASRVTTGEIKSIFLTKIGIKSTDSIGAVRDRLRSALSMDDKTLLKENDLGNYLAEGSESDSIEKERAKITREGIERLIAWTSAKAKEANKSIQSGKN